MKKFTVILFAAMLTINGFAQTRLSNPANHLNSPGWLSINQNQADAMKSKIMDNTSRTTGSEWVNYAEQCDVYYHSSAGIYSDALFHLFPDSTIILGFDNTTGLPYNTWISHGGTMIDPTHMPDAWLNSASNYSLDSLAVIYAYTRMTASNIVDTLRIDLIKSLDANLYTLSSGETYQDIIYDYPTNNVAANNILATYKIPLTEADSTTLNQDGTVSLSTMQWATPHSLAQGARVGAVFTFLPGYTHTPQDSLFGKNAFLILSQEENGAATDPVYYGDNNCSYILPNDVRYNINANGWNGYFIPTWAWTTPYAYEHHYIYFKLTSPNVGIGNVNVPVIEPVFPNPADGIVNLVYGIHNDDNITINIYDLAGSLISSINKGSVVKGTSVETVDVSNFANGVYMYSVETPTSSAMGKFVVSH